jgi:hypothetical protein
MINPNGSPGINKLANELSKRSRAEASYAPRDLVLDFGVINGDKSLTTNTFPKPIPATDYSICRSLTIGAAGATLTSVSGGQHGGHESGNGSHTHAVPIPEKLRSVLPGDRVLVAWIQSEPVVIDIVMKGTSA